MSNKVKVLFKGFDLRTPDIKDLNDILAPGPGAASRTHWLASCLIRRLRSPINGIDDVLAILRPRNTSWVRDRTIIAGLLANIPRCDYSRSESAITRTIIGHIGTVPYTSLLHGQPSMCESGGFSWCPATLDEVPIDLCTDNLMHAKGFGILAVDNTGVVMGSWVLPANN
jgi:hypothetical protein